MQHFQHALTLRNNTVTYKGFGYEYFLHRATKLGTYAKLRIARDAFNAFRHMQERAPQVFNKQGQCVAKVAPKINDLQGLEIFAGAGGWYTVTVMNEEHASMVTKFLARLNQWMLARRNALHKGQLRVLADNCLHKVYQIALDYRGRPTNHAPTKQSKPFPQRVADRRPAVSNDKLQQLVNTVNKRFGHV